MKWMFNWNGIIDTNVDALAVQANLRQIPFKIEYKSLDFRTLVGLEIETARIGRRPMVCSGRFASVSELFNCNYQMSQFIKWTLSEVRRPEIDSFMEINLHSRLIQWKYGLVSCLLRYSIKVQAKSLANNKQTTDMCVCVPSACCIFHQSDVSSIGYSEMRSNVNLWNSQSVN